MIFFEWCHSPFLQVDNFQIKLSPHPVFITPPSDTVVAQGSPVRFDCDFTASNPVSIGWVKDGNTVTPSSRLMYLTNSSLLVSPTQSGDDGTYTCVITDQITMQSAQRSATLTFACEYILHISSIQNSTTNTYTHTHSSYTEQLLIKSREPNSR